MKHLVLNSVAVGLAFLTQAAQAFVTIGPNTTISFEPGKANLTIESEAKLNVLVKQARSQGKIDDMKIAVWSDNPAPREGEELAKVDRDLAAARGHAIKSWLKHHKVSDIDTYNMAERASWLARVFSTDAADFKTETGGGNDSHMFREEFQIFKTHGNASKAVIVSLVKHRH